MNDFLRNTFLLAGGLAAGFAAGILLAPKSGKETREDLASKIDELQKQVKDLSGEARIKVEEKIGQLKDTLKEVEGAISN